MKKWKWLIWIAAGTLLLFYTRTESKQDQASANETVIKTYDPKYNPNQTMIDYLIFRSMLSGEARMAVTGSSVTRGSGSSHTSKTWRGIIEQNLRQSHPILKNLTISNYGHSGYTSVRLLEDHVKNPILSEEPDVLFIETSVINNHNKNVTIEDTFASLDELYSLYTTALPNVRLLFLSPNPCTENKFGPSINQLGLSYTDYIEKTADYIQQKGWTYFDTHSAMTEQMNARNITRPSTLKDGIHPNDLGYKIWGQVLWTFMQKPT